MQPAAIDSALALSTRNFDARAIDVIYTGPAALCIQFDIAAVRARQLAGITRRAASLYFEESASACAAGAEYRVLHMYTFRRVPNGTRIYVLSTFGVPTEQSSILLLLTFCNARFLVCLRPLWLPIRYV